jgi:dipeptidyl aminopeptidase/acylaminoacyl peptidase
MIDMSRLSLFLLLAGLVLFSCSAPQDKEKTAPLIGKKEVKLSTDRLTPEALWSLGRVGEFDVSPDGKQIVFGVTYYDIQQNKGNREIYLINSDGSGLKQLTETPQNEFNYAWRPDGKKIGYISTASGTAQVWEMNPDGSAKKKISEIEGGVNGFKYSPDMKKIAFSSEVFLEERDLNDLYEGLPLAEGKVINRMMFRHWDEWRETYSHLFLADYSEAGMTNPVDIMAGEPWDFPLKPFWGMEQISWHPDGKSLAYSCKKKESMAYAISTNSDIYLYDLERKQAVNFTRGMMGYDLNPAFSPDGRYLAWQSMARDGYEADKNNIVVFDTEKKSKTTYTDYFDADAEEINWSKDGQSIYFLSYWYGAKEIFNLNLNGKITQLTNGVHDFTAIKTTKDKLIASMMSMSMPPEIFTVPLEGGKEKQVTFTNKDLLDQMTFGKVERRWTTTTDGKKMLSWVIFPPRFDERKQYPTLLFCEGGPQNAVSQFWSFRWNFQIMAANDYIIIAPNRRGVPGFGQAWKEQISGDYSGQNIRDYLSAIDDMATEPYVAKDLMGAVGASYGGYSVYYLAGHHEKRFRAFIAHDGMFNIESAYLETDEQWFPHFDMGGAPWETDNPVAMKSYANSPHKFVKNWDTPILIIHGEKDYRVLATQGMMAFNAAQLLAVPSQFLYLPDENHWVLSPQNGILWQRTFFKWLDTWLKPPTWKNHGLWRPDPFFSKQPAEAQ